jgi:F-type H+-transporting ATPase subunit b
MEETLRQLGGLLLGAIPTVILFLILLMSYRLILHNPLERTLEERHSRTTGAVAKARADVAAAEAKTSEYETRLRDARLGIFRAQEQRRRQAIEARTAAIAEARARAEADIRAARDLIAQDLEAGKAGLQGEAERLATEVVHAVLKQVGASPAPVGGVR